MHDGVVAKKHRSGYMQKQKTMQRAMLSSFHPKSKTSNK